MTLHEYIASLRRSWWIILLLAAIGAGAGFGYATVQPKVYRAQADVVIIPARGASTSELVQGSNYVQNLVQTYALVATSPTVLEPVVDRLGLDSTPRALATSVSVQAPLNTQVLEIGVTSRDADTAAAVANAIGSQLAVAVRDLSPQFDDAQPAVRIETITPATPPNAPISPNVRLLTLLGGLAGLVAGVVYALLRRLLATRLSSHVDIAAVSDIAVLGDVYTTGSSRSLPGVIRTDATSAVAESVRSFVAGLRFANVDGAKKVLLFTSSHSGDGKSSMSIATALILAEQGNSVLLIDADLRRASIATLSQLEGSVGLTSILLGETTMDVAVQPLGNDGAQVLTSGVLPPNPGQILTSELLRGVIAEAREQYDFVIVDTPPVLAVSDPLWLAPLVDGIVIVVRSRVTKRDALRRTLLALESSPTPVLGLVLNDVRRTQSSAYYEDQAGRSARLKRKDPTSVRENVSRR
ncbi:Tyrosine-protein kinase YwqD [Microbacterium lemovicicum]|uniref:Tyrosine-protein kinase YwqD n=1 Tax=Microbacterium lemovicicum TaxID=1072463 RepID=A0A3S9W679_9MICO|nr:polysaccharide biosynthesis tyrosine autokinase [Microbacterium lemovicicum]AZS35607.1 Tyrosine-protein kinase YwqD [Microbacterium lemovicicum]